MLICPTQATQIILYPTGVEVQRRIDPPVSSENQLIWVVENLSPYLDPNTVQINL